MIDHEVIIVGAGFAGLCAAIRLREAGITDFVILERANDIGGTWRDNTYPGVAVDIPSVMYQFSFAQTTSWTRTFAPGAEVKSYVDSIADKFTLRPHIRLGREVVDAAFDPRHHHWSVTTSDGRVETARFLISAHGIFAHPRVPDIQGVDSFAGKTIHTLYWDHTHDLTGQRVAIIGTGASAVQVVPAIARRVAHLDVYQRTPIWIVPRGDRAIPPRTRRLLERFPPLRWATRTLISTAIELAMLIGVTNHTRVPFLVRTIRKRSEEFLRRQVKDPTTRAKLLPTYEFGCKRPGMSNDYWRTFNRPNVSLITTPIRRIRPEGIETEDGSVHEIDTLILATGFKFLDYDSIPGYPLRGEDGTDIRNWWLTHGFQSYEGITVPTFPNLFLIPAPLFATSWSWLIMTETQTRHAQRIIAHTLKKAATYAAIRQPAHDRYVTKMRHLHPKGLFLTPACTGSNSYYLDRTGQPSIIRPQSSITARWRANHFPFSDYELRTTTATTSPKPSKTHAPNGAPR